MLIIIGLVLVSYVIGSIPTGVLVAKARGIDIFAVGSGSSGATNVWRSVGKKEGAFVMVADLLKGYLPVVLAQYLEQGPLAAQMQIGIQGLAPVLVALASLIGHSKSIFINWRGGKSAATGLGTILALNPICGGIIFALWIAIVLTTKLVSLASIVAGIAVSIMMYLLHGPMPYVVYCLAAGLYVVVRHKANIARLVKGQEPKIGAAKKS